MGRKGEKTREGRGEGERRGGKGRGQPPPNILA